MIDILHILKLARSKISLANKKLLYLAFENDIAYLIDLLKNTANDYLVLDEDIKQEYAITLKNSCNFLTLSNNQYPKLLKQIDTAPIILTTKGNNDILHRQSVAVVGSRSISTEDINFIKPAIQALNNADLVVISGFACGTDAIAHINSLQTGTIAVLPCGLETCYPKEHLFLAKQIVENGGVLVSEFAFSEQPKQYQFTQRNRIIVATSNAVLCCRARTMRSGTMSSANYAIKYDKSIYTHIFNGDSEGNKWLLNNGAIEIDDFDNTTYSIMADVAKNELLLQQSNTNSLINENNTCNLFLSQSKHDINKTNNDKNINKNIPYSSLKNEIDTIIKHTNLSKNEKNLQHILALCKNQLQIEDKPILTILIPEIFGKK